MHAINICIRRKYNIIITQFFIAIFYIKRMLQQIKFFIFINHFLGKAKAIQRLTTQTKNCLGFHIPGFCNRAAGAIPFCDKDGCFETPCIYFIFVFSFRDIIKMIAAIPEFFVMEICFFCSFVGQFFYTGQFLTLSFILFNPLFNCISS